MIKNKMEEFIMEKIFGFSTEDVFKNIQNLNERILSNPRDPSIIKNIFSGKITSDKMLDRASLIICEKSTIGEPLSFCKKNKPSFVFAWKENPKSNIKIKYFLNKQGQLTNISYL